MTRRGLLPWVALVGAVLYFVCAPSGPIPIRVDSRGVPQSIHGPSPPAPIEVRCYACHTVHEDPSR